MTLTHVVEPDYAAAAAEAYLMVAADTAIVEHAKGLFEALQTAATYSPMPAEAAVYRRMAATLSATFPFLPVTK